MAEPNEPLTGLVIPNTGDLVGAWGTAALNANFQAIGGMLGGVVSISLSGATSIALTAPSGSLTPGGGPTQQQNALIRFSGVQTGNALVSFTRPGMFVIDNQCTGNSIFAVQLLPVAGNAIGIPRGKKTWVFHDGTNMDFVNPPDPGTAYDLHGAIALPGWMNACTIKPYLIKDGATYSVASYTALAAVLGSTFGGDGVTTFGVPDESARMRLAWDSKGSGRVTSGGSGIAGATMGAAGGDQLMQAHTHGASATDSGHTHGQQANTMINTGGSLYAGGGPNTGNANTGGTTQTGNAIISVNVATTGSGGSQNMPPAIVSFLALIKT
jgi:microcystin-dependent protein